MPVKRWRAALAGRPPAGRHSAGALVGLALALAAPGARSEPGAPQPTIVALGDSLTAAGYADELGPRFHAKVITLALGGQSSDAIAARFRAAPIYIVVPKGQLSAGPNALSVAPQFLRTSDTVTRTTGATIAGVHGTYARHAHGAMPAIVEDDLFTPDAGATLPVAVPQGTVMTIDPPAPRADLLIVCAGRNDHPPAFPRQTEAMIARIAERQRAAGGALLVLGVPNSTSEPRGSAGYAAIVALNADLAREYPGHFLDMRRAYNSGGDPHLPADAADRAQDVPPRSLRGDLVHYNDAGRHAWARAVGDFIAANHLLPGTVPAAKGRT